MALFVFIALVFAAAITGSVFRPDAWYDRLEKPWWNPPKWLFPVAWTVIYAMIAAAGYFVWEATGTIGLPLVFWGAQLVFNALWSPIFFGLKRPGWALAEVSLLWLSILGCIVTFFPVSPAAGWLMVPYLVWVSYAAALNAWIHNRNPDAHAMAGGA